MPWKAKVVLLFNEGKMPKFEAGEGALIRRMLVVQHRSKFCDEGTYQEEQQRPHTFLKDAVPPTTRFTPCVVMAWMLEGLARFRTAALGSVPISVQGFKRDLVKEHDQVALWAEEALEAGDADTDFVRQKDAVDRFRKATGDKMPTKTFKDRLVQCMSGKGVSLTEVRWHGAEQLTVRSAFWGVKMVN